MEDEDAEQNKDGNMPVHMAPNMFVVLSGIFSVHVRCAFFNWVKGVECRV